MHNHLVLSLGDSNLPFKRLRCPLDKQFLSHCASFFFVSFSSVFFEKYFVTKLRDFYGILNQLRCCSFWFQFFPVHSVVAEDWELRIEKRGRLLHDWLKFSRRYHKGWREQEQKCYFEQLGWLPFRVYGANKNFLITNYKGKKIFFRIWYKWVVSIR